MAEDYEQLKVEIQEILNSTSIDDILLPEQKERIVRLLDILQGLQDADSSDYETGLSLFLLNKAFFHMLAKRNWPRADYYLEQINVLLND